jgi:hypothetical protein
MAGLYVQVQNALEDSDSASDADSDFDSDFDSDSDFDYRLSTIDL